MRVWNRETGDSFGIWGGEGRIWRLRRRVGCWSEVVREYWEDEVYLKTMVTLTYRPGEEWEANQINGFCRVVKRYLGDYLIGVAWVAELQKRGAVHYHVLIVQKRGRVLGKPDEAGLWPYGYTQISVARSWRYLIKYAQKAGRQGWFLLPRGLRIFAVMVALGVASDGVKRLRLSSLPAWLEESVADYVMGGVEFPKRLEGGGWGFLGGVIESPFEVIFDDD